MARKTSAFRSARHQCSQQSGPCCGAQYHITRHVQVDVAGSAFRGEDGDPARPLMKRTTSKHLRSVHLPDRSWLDGNVGSGNGLGDGEVLGAMDYCASCCWALLVFVVDLLSDFFTPLPLGFSSSMRAWGRPWKMYFLRSLDVAAKISGAKSKFLEMTDLGVCAITV